MDQQNLASGVLHGTAHAATAVAPAMAPVEEYTVKPISTAKLTPRRQFKLATTRLAIILATVFTGRYFYWRVLHTVNPAAIVFFYAFLVVEILSFVESLFFYFVTWNPTHYAQPQPLSGRTIDVFIPTYNEPVELLRETVLCAVNMRYPHKTYILDDGRRSEVRELAQEFGCGYITRDDRAHAKAGNLNNALRQTDGEFIVTLDADHVASPELIEELIGFFRDPAVAVVQGTQDFYNLDSFQHQVNWSTRAGWQQQELFFSVIQPGKDRYNAAFYCGSPGILRRSALADVGGFATESITEDMHTSMKLQKKGWRVLYQNRTVARGLAPQTFSSFATQWQRWGHGAMQVLRAEKPFRTKGLAFTQKIAYFSSFYFYWMSYQKLAFVITPIITLFFGVFPLLTDPVSYANYFLPYFCLNIASSVLLQGGWKNFMMSERFNLLKMHVLMKTLTGLFHRDSPFTVTRKSRASAPRASEVLLPFLLLAGLVLALAAGIVRVQIVRPWGFMFWALAVNIFWGFVFLFMMGGMVWRSQKRLEHRKSYRFPSHLELRMSVSYKEPGGAEVKRDGFARNLNRSGVSVTFEREIPQGTKVEVELRLPEQTIHATGKVVRNQIYGKNGHSRISNGIRFDNIAAADQDEISKYLFWEVAPQHSQVHQVYLRIPERLQCISTESVQVCMATLPVRETAGTATPRSRKNTSQTLAPSASEDYFRIEHAVAVMLIAVAAVYLRAVAPRYSTAYMDESIYVVYGRMFLSRHFEAPLDTPLQWSFGWYLWPAMAAAADRIGGLLALRELAAGLGTVTVSATYGFATRVFNKTVGLGAAAVMAVLGPALLVSKIATRDSGSICFFALGLWAYATAWQKNRKRDWALAAVCFFAAFLCKYLVAVFFPFLVLLALRKGRRPLLLFALPLFAFCAAYAALHAGDLYHLLRYGSVYSSLRAPSGEAWKIYLSRRWDFWILVVAALPLFALREWRTRAAVLWLGIFTILAVQWKTRADYDYWKHVNYAFLFLAPLAVAGVVFLVQELQKKNYHGQMMWGVGGVIALAVTVGWAGQAQSIDRFVFWPNITPILAYFENRLTPNDRILVDDTVLRYYFGPPLHQYQIVDPMYFSRGGKSGDEAYRAAVRESEFDYVVLDGGIGGEAHQMDDAIRPELSGYQLEMTAVEPTLGQTIQIYAKSGHTLPAASGPSIRILSPASNAVVSTNAAEMTTVEGQAYGIHAGWYVHVDVFTDQWHPQGDDIQIGANGSFHQTINLAGQGRQQCYHIIRARLLDQSGNSRAVTMNYGVGRADAQRVCKGHL